jgi:ketosteroid isomerase-like protein
MSRENVEVVRGIYEAVARRDSDAPFAAYAEDIVWDQSNSKRAAVSGAPVYLGHEGVRRFWRDALEVFGAIDLEVEELIDAGEHVVAAIREREVGRTSGAAVENGHVAVWTLADGKVTRMRIFDERREALEAVGLTE